jgi:hypothetical protein
MAIRTPQDGSWANAKFMIVQPRDHADVDHGVKIARSDASAVMSNAPVSEVFTYAADHFAAASHHR